MKSFRDQVYEIVRKVPGGKVTTYGEIASTIHLRGESCRSSCVHLGGGHLARAVGNALHKNKDPNVPCHRVVDRNGRIAQNYGFGGWKVQRRWLVREGIKFKDELHVDLRKIS